MSKIASKIFLIILVTYSRVPNSKAVTTTSSELNANTTGELEKVIYEEPENEFGQTAELLRPITTFIKNDNCSRQLNIFLQGISNSSSWAIQMLDATSKIPTGLVTANSYQFGNYDECIEVFEPIHNVRGKYCLADVQFAPLRKKYPPFYRDVMENEFSLYYNPNKPVWEKFKVTRDPSKKRRDIFHTGVCVPNACTAEDTQIILTHISSNLGERYGFDFKITIKENFCSTNEEKTIDAGGKTLSAVMIMFIASVLYCTIWDSSTKQQGNSKGGKLQNLMESFSIKRNIAKLTKPDLNTEMDVFHGMKTLSMVLIILGHRCMNTYGGPFFNPQFLEERYRNFQDMLLLNGTLIVDTFFLISGYITFVALFKICEEKKKLNIFKVYLHRWFRITPMYMMLVFFYAYLLEHLGNGPVWSTKVGREAERCRQNWWTNFFYVNNYVNTEKLCIFQSWYVSCEIHFIVLAPIIVKLIVKSARRGIALLTFIISVSIIVPFTITYTKKYDGVLRVYMSIFEDIVQSFYFSEVYIKTHNRAIPYFIGMASAYFYIRLKKSRYQFTKMQVWIFSALCIFFSLSSLLGAWLFYIPGRKYNALENALYASFHRVFWALSMAWLPIAGGRRAFGVIQPLLTKKFYVPLSRLSFGAFLVHGAIQMYTTATLRTPEYMCFSKLFWMTAGDVVMSFILAFVIYVLFEAPFKGLQTLVLDSKKPDEASEEAKKLKDQNNLTSTRQNTNITESEKRKCT